MIWYIFSLNHNGRWRNWWRDWFDVAIARSILLPSASALHNWCNHVSNMSIRLSWSACYLSGIYSHFTDTRAFREVGRWSWAMRSCLQLAFQLSSRRCWRGLRVVILCAQVNFVHTPFLRIFFFHVGPAWNSCQGVQRKKLSVAENNPWIKGRTGQQLSRKKKKPFGQLYTCEVNIFDVDFSGTDRLYVQKLFKKRTLSCRCFVSFKSGLNEDVHCFPSSSESSPSFMSSYRVSFLLPDCPSLLITACDLISTHLCVCMCFSLLF